MGIRQRPLVLGHRGFRALYPENTLLAFRQAIENRADGVECDIQKTADGRYVVIHDPTTGRVTGIGNEVAKTSFEDLRGLDFGRGERIPELSELLDAIPPGSYLDLELKEETIAIEDCGPIAAMLDARIPRRHLMVSSFQPQLLMPFRRRGFTVGFLIGEESAARGIRALLRALFQLRPQYLNLPVQLVEKLGPALAPVLLALARLMGFSLLFWTVNTGAEAARVVNSARIIVTDQVDNLVRFLDQSTSRK
jgi:glycerophosphoryl diester phosphodiesterase